MSPPDTNVPKQTRRHRPALLAIMGAIGAIAVILFLTTVFVPDEQEQAPLSDGATEQETD